MRAVQYSVTGDPDVLTAVDRPMPEPGPGRIFSQVYAEPSPVLDAQRDAYLAYRSSFEAGA